MDMRLEHPGRLLVLVGLAMLAALALSQGHAEAKAYADWPVAHDETHTGEVITVSGTLTVDFMAHLELRGCTITFTNPTPGATLATVRGMLDLEGTRVFSVGHGTISVERGYLTITGGSMLSRVDLSVWSMGTLDVSSADLDVRGTSVTDLATLNVQGGLGVFGSNVTLSYALLRATGSVNMSQSRLDAYGDWGHGAYSRVTFQGGSVVARDVSFKDLFNGIQVSSELAAEGCTFTRADVFDSFYDSGLRASLVGSGFVSSSLTFEVPGGITGVADVHVLLRNVTVQDGRVEFNASSMTGGDVLLDGVSVSTTQDYAIRVRSSGTYGTFRMTGLDIDAPYGIQALDYFDGLVIENATVRATEIALDLSGAQGTPKASVVGLSADGAARGIQVRRAQVDARECDLSGATIPVWAGDDAHVQLSDCALPEAAARLEPTAPGAGAWLYVQRTMEIGGVEWYRVGIPITSGDVELSAVNASMGARYTAHWTIGTAPFPAIRILEWNASRDPAGARWETRVAYHEVYGQFELGDHVFKTPDPLDPWNQGPMELQFLDDARPTITVDGPDLRVVNEPIIDLHGTVSDLGTGLDLVRWALENSTGDDVNSGALTPVDGRWSAPITLTGNFLRVRIDAWDIAGNYEPYLMLPIRVDVPPPTLTVISPRDGELTSDPHLTVSGSASAYATYVDVQIGVSTVRVPVGADGLFFTTALPLPPEGAVEVFVTSYDPFGNSDSKRVTVDLDMTPPSLEFAGLRTDATNYVRTPALVIEGRTDDPKARIWVDDQLVGVLVNRTFATTVQLREGRQTIKVVARDSADNLDGVELAVVLDTVAPVLQLLDPSSNPFYVNADSVDVLVESSEPVSRATRDGLPVAMPGGRMSFTHEFLQDGRKEYVLRATDLAGNEGGLTVVLVRDTVAPRLTIISPKDGAVVNHVTVDLLVHLSEGDCRLLVDGDPVDASDIGSGRLEGTVALLGGDGVHVLTVRAEDLAGNADEMRISLDLDTVPPTIELIGLGARMKVTTEPLEVRGTTEPLSKVVWVNGVMAALGPDGSFSATLHLDEGWRYVNVTAVDRADNSNNISVPLRVLAAPKLGLPWQAAAGATILIVFGALLGSTEIGRWSLSLLFLPLYTKLRKDRILDQRTRGLIQGYIMANPGCNYTLLRDNLDLADGTLTYHLQVLEREGFVYSIREGLFRCFYPTGLPPPRRGKLHLSDTQADIIRISKRIPGITVGEIATAMNRRPNVISYHLKLLREGGLVTLEEDGRHVRVYPVDTAVAMI